MPRDKKVVIKWQKTKTVEQAEAEAQSLIKKALAKAATDKPEK